MAISRKPLENTYKLFNKNTRIDRAEIERALHDPEYMMGNFSQIVNKGTQTVPFVWNDFQKELNQVFMPLINPTTRLNRKHYVVVVKPRQVGATTGNIGLWNNVMAYAEGINNLNLLHILPVQGTISALARDKVEPIFTGVHPNLFADIYKKNDNGTIVYEYDNIKGNKRNNIYQLVSSNTKAIRGTTNHIVLFDECLSGDVEILTDKGFRRFDSLDKTEKVAQYDCKTEGISFVKPLRYIDKPYEGDAYKWSTNGHSFISTPFHAFVVGQRGVVNRKGNKYQRKLACEFTPTGNYDLPTWGVGVAPHKPLTALERLGIATQADGSIDGVRERKGCNGDNVGWVRCKLGVSRPSKVRRMRMLLKEAGLPYKETVHPSRPEMTHFYYDLPYENPKLLPSFLDVNCSYERAREILHEVLHWDSYGLDREKMDGQAFLPRTSYYSSIVEANRDFVAAIALQAGGHIHTSVQKDDREDTHKDVYRLNITQRLNSSYQSFNRETVDYKGRVYCVEVPTGCIVVRTGGKVWVCGNCSFYNRPEDLEAAVLPSIPSYGFSLVVYLSTFEDNKNTFFLEKIQTAIQNPDDYTLVFVPWYKIYPESPDRRGIDFDTLELTEYDRDVIVPEFQKNNFPRERWGDAIDWYHRTSAGFKSMKKEFPTTLDELLESGKNEPVFSLEDIEKQRAAIMEGHMVDITEDKRTKKLRLQPADISPVKVFRNPIPGQQYVLCVDPITAIGDDTDNFAATMMNRNTYEQVATIHGRGIQLEDWADLSVALCKIFNNAIICPEINVGGEFVAFVKSQGYHRFYYDSPVNKKNKVPGIRTTVTSKDRMIKSLGLLLKGGKMVLHDPVWIGELETFELKKKVRADKTVTVKMEARSGKHDDTVSSLWCFAGMLGDEQLLSTPHNYYGFI